MAGDLSVADHNNLPVYSHPVQLDAPFLSSIMLVRMLLSQLWEGRDCQMKLRAVILHSRMENHFTSSACLENYHVYHCGLKEANGKLIPKSEVQGDTVMARNIQGRYYSVCLAIYELI